MKLIAYIGLISAILVYAPLNAEELQLKDGTKVSGTIIAVTGDTFQVRTAYGEIQIPRSQVVSIMFPENQAAASGTKNVPKVDESFHSGTYTNRTANFEVSVPQNWKLSPELRQQAPDVIAAFMSDDNTLFFLVTPEKFTGTLKTYEVLAETQYQVKFKDYEKLSETEAEVDGQKAIRLIWHGKNTAANDSPIKALVYIIPYEGRMVRLSFLTLEPLFNDALPVFEKVAASYHGIRPVQEATFQQYTKSDSHQSDI